MKHISTYKILHLMVVVLILAAGTAFAAGAAEATGQPQSTNYQTIEGVLTIKEGHGDFLVRMPDGSAQRFSIKAGAGAVEITRNGKPARYNELKVGDSIAVKYDPSNRQVVAIHAGQTAQKTGNAQSGTYETVVGVLSIKEGHGDFLIRLSDGRAQRFSVRGNEAEIFRNGSPARYNELKVKDSVRVKYNANNRKFVAIHAIGA
jgi:hypothetical protein